MRSLGRTSRTGNCGGMDKEQSSSVTLFARTNFRDIRTVFGIKQADRRAHMYLIGKTGTGKSTLLETMIRQDMQNGQGFALIDPHGDLVERVVEAAPECRRADLIYFNVPTASRTLGFNPLEQVPPEIRPLAASGILEVFKKLWADSWGPRLEHILRNALLALMDQTQATLADILRLLDDRAYRTAAAGLVSNPQVRTFWLHEYEGYPARFRAEAIAPIQNKVGAFLADPRLFAILTKPRSTFDLRQVMAQGKILLVNLSKGRIGEDTAALLGALLVSAISLAGLGRADRPERARRDFFVYLDEFQTYTTLSLASMLSELRKYRVGMVLAHQYLSQLDPRIRDAILGNVGTLITFRIGLPDAEILEKEFAPQFSANDLINLPNHQMYVKLMIDGVISPPFSGESMRLV